MDIRTSLRRLLLGTLVLAAGPLLAARPALPPVPGEVIVKFKADAASVRVHALSSRSETAAVRSALSGRATALGQRVGRALEAGDAVGMHTQVVRAKGMSSAALVALLKADAEVEYVEPVQRVRRHTAPNDPYYLAGPSVSGNTGGPVVGQWYLRTPTANAATSTSDLVSSIGIEAAWNRTLGASTVVVAVLDTGVRKEHPDLAGRLLAGYDFVSDVEVANDGDGRDGDPSDPGDYTTAAENSNPSGTFYQCDPSGTGRAVATPSSWHGTSTASLVGAAANDGIGMAGAAPGVKVLPVRVLGKCFGNSADIFAGMRWAAGISVPGVPDNPNPARVINMSLGGGTCSAAYQDVVNEVLAKGVVIVASAGNSEGEPMEAPASCSGVIGVTALRNVGTKVGFSSLGTIGSQPTIGAPGGNCVNLTGACLYPILAATNTGSTVPVASGYSDSFNTTLGTSFSSPLVAAVAGLIVSVNPGATPAQVKNYLTSTARSFPTTGGGTAGMGVCRSAVSGVVQDECYCNSFCGAGMLDAGAAVAAAAGSTVTPPSAAITVSPASPVAGQTVTLTSSSTAGSFTITGYLWRLVSGGGALPALSNGSTLGSASSVTLSPTATGTVQVSLQVTDAGGNTNQTTTSFTVGTAAGPTSSFTVTPAAPSAGSAFTLTSTATAGSFAIASRLWTLVDGGGIVSGTANGASLGTGSTATITATGAGTVVVSLRVTDTAGNTGTAQQSVTVTAAAAGGGSGGGGGGGGTTSPFWLAGLALAVLALFRTRPGRA